jgi:glycosyltransferase XagB
VLAGTLAVWWRGRRGRVVRTLQVPVYWLAISLAAFRALGELVTAPFNWEKMRHRERVRRSKR